MDRKTWIMTVYGSIGTACSPCECHEKVAHQVDFQPDVLKKMNEAYHDIFDHHKEPEHVLEVPAVVQAFGIPLHSHGLYSSRPQNQRRRVEVKRGAEALKELDPQNPIDPQLGRKGYHEDFKRLDNDPFDLQALETKARRFNFHTLDTGDGTSRQWTVQIVP